MEASSPWRHPVCEHAEWNGGLPAVISERGSLTYAELNGMTNRLVRALRARGLKAGDGVCLTCSNRPEFAVVWAACMRAGWVITPINWHLKQDDLLYIVENSQARALIAEDRAAAGVAGSEGIAALRARISIGDDPLPGFTPFSAFCAGQDDHDIKDQVPGKRMSYTSGTTGRPKGVLRPPIDPEIREARRRQTPEPLIAGESVSMCTGPLYHAAPLEYDLIAPLTEGATALLMDKWDTRQALSWISRYRVTHTHMVATMFHRLLQIPEEERRTYDLSSLKRVTHGAAPTPVHIKQAMIDWLGPVIFEYYGGSEGGGTTITSEQWLAKPGSVGLPRADAAVYIHDKQGHELPAGQRGIVYFRIPREGGFRYFNDPEKTKKAWQGDRFTMGDHGYIDEDGYLFLTGRTSELIIAGGVNIYPAEIDSVLLMHPAVADAASVGVPNDEYGEEVKAVIETKKGTATGGELADDIMAFCRKHLAKYKCPRSVDFVEQLPRSGPGKVLRQQVRDAYWPAH